jgi:hypothetical protein
MPERIERRVRIVTNALGGGYGLSDAATRELARRKGIALREEAGRLFVGAEGYDRLSEIVPRDDADLVAVEDNRGCETVAGWIGEA